MICGCQQISTEYIVFVILEVVADCAMCQAIKFARAVETMVVVALLSVAVQKLVGESTLRPARTELLEPTCNNEELSLTDVFDFNR